LDNWTENITTFLKHTEIRFQNHRYDG